MMLFKPTLRLNILKVLRNKKPAYIGNFHSGVNIVSGQNASGKSTIMDFIFYALGGENVPWKNEALLCDEVIAEISLNNGTITLRRYINENPKNSIYIFWGKLSDAEGASATAWEMYPYQRSVSKESFSQVLFRLLELPELRGEGASNITMHQILRLMYVDQRTPHDQIFRAEAFDTLLTRETIGNYLCGVYSSELYDAQIELKTVDAQLARSVSDLRSLFSVLGRSGQVGNTSDFLRAEAASIQEEVATTEIQLLDLRQTRGTVKSGETARADSKLRAQLSKSKRELSNTNEEIAEIQLEIEDSKLFINELERRLEALDDSATARSYLGAIHFSYCPCCLTPTPEISNKNSCGLCKNEIDNSAADSQLLRMKNELAIQKKESSGLLESRAEKLNRLNEHLPALQNALRKLEQEYSQQNSSWNSPIELQIEALSRRLGELNQKLEQIAQYQQLASVIEGLQEKRSQFEDRKSKLQDLILSIENRDEKLKSKSRLSIAESLVALLKKDLPRQEEFINASSSDWSFGHDRIVINGHTQFSESSMVILKQCFHLALLQASTKNSSFRLPRFILLDGIEDGGQEIGRSHKLQENIAELSDSLEAEHQIIFATSQIAQSLNTPAYVVGSTSTVENKTLLIL